MVEYALQQICAWMDAKIDERKSSLDTFKPFSGVAVDTRHVQPGNLFFALSGQKTDGHHFLNEAAAKGATGAVVKRSFYEEARDSVPQLTLLYVDDPLLALQTAAKKWLEHSSARVIAITGSLGKTSTKGFLFSLLQSKYKVATTSGSKNSQIGLALAILNETKGVEDYLILEMGMSEKGHIQKLVEMAPPHLALITSIALVHAENFHEISDIAQAKAEVFSHPKTECVILNNDTRCVSDLLQMVRCKKESYSLQEGAVVKWKMKIEADCLVVTEDCIEIILPKVNMMAEHMYGNLLGAISCARELGMSFEEIKVALKEITLPERRLQEVEKKGVTFINDAYNAAEDSMKGALDAMRQKKCAGRKIAVLGHMRELGKFSDGCHKSVGEFALTCVDQVISIGENAGPLVKVWQEAQRPVEWFLQFEELFCYLQNEICEGDLVLVKGARTLELERIIDRY